MKTPEIIIARPNSNAKIKALKAVMKALEIKFEISSGDKKYNPEFVEEILKGDEDFKNGNYKVIKTKDLWK